MECSGIEVTMDSDFLLIQRMKSGDEQAIDVFVHKYYPVIFRYCRLHINDYGHAEDITQEAFERFFRTLERYHHYGKAANYLYVIAANACRDYYRKKDEPVMEIVPEHAVSKTENLEDYVDVRMALDSLPPEIKEAAILFFCQEIKQKEIAKILGIGLPLVKYRIRKARELLSGYLREEP